MLLLTPETEQLARRVAARLGRKPEDLIRFAIDREAKVLGVVYKPPARQKITVADIMEFGEKAGARPILDPRSPQEIADDISA